MVTFVCANCGFPAAHDPNAVDLDSGTVLTCDQCGDETVVDLFTPAERRKLYEARSIVKIFADLAETEPRVRLECAGCGALWDLRHLTLQHKDGCPWKKIISLFEAES